MDWQEECDAWRASGVEPRITRRRKADAAPLEWAMYLEFKFVGRARKHNASVTTGSTSYASDMASLMKSIKQHSKNVMVAVRSAGSQKVWTGDCLLIIVTKQMRTEDYSVNDVTQLLGC